MNLNIRGNRMELTQALKDYADKKLSRLEKYFESPLSSEVNVTMSVRRNLHSVEVTIPLQSVLLRAEEQSEDMYASIDLVVDKLERQIRKHKTKVNRKLRIDSGLKAVFKENVDNGASKLVDEDDDLEIVRTKRFMMKPMDLEEAVLQMNMLGHNFFVFANMEANEKINVVYKRNDGKYGLIEPM